MTMNDIKIPMYQHYSIKDWVCYTWIDFNKFKYEIPPNAEIVNLLEQEPFPIKDYENNMW